MALRGAVSSRGPEALPTTGVAWTRSIVDATIAVVSGGGFGIGLLAIAMLVIATGYPALRDTAEVTKLSLPVLGVSAATVTLFGALLGPAFTAHAIALMHMYRDLPAKSLELRNVVEFRGQVPRRQLFPLAVSLVCVGSATALAAIPAALLGMEYSQRPYDPDAARLAPMFFGATAACAIVVFATFAGVLLCRHIENTRLSAALQALPAQAVGHTGPHRQRVRGDDKPKLAQLAADSRRLRTGPQRMQAILFLALAVGLLGICLTGTVRAVPEPVSPGWALLANGSELCTVTSAALLLAVHLVRWVELIQLPERIRRKGQGVSATDRRRAGALTSDLRAQMQQSMALWSLLGIALTGLSFAQGSALHFALVITAWSLGIAALIYLRVRLERNGPALREEFGYEIPVEVNTGDSGTAGW